eukprot:6029701-Amphidinium_carterae.1
MKVLILARALGDKSEEPFAMETRTEGQISKEATSKTEDATEPEPGLFLQSSGSKGSCAKQNSCVPAQDAALAAMDALN